MQQFYGMIICDDSRWLWVLEQYHVNNPEGWADFKANFRRYIAQCSCEVNRRHSARFNRWNFLMSRLVDGRLSYDERIHTADACRSAHARGCCMEEDCATRLMNLPCMNSIVSMLDITAQLILLAVFWSFNLTTAVAECLHARNHNILHPRNAWAVFAANCTTA